MPSFKNVYELENKSIKTISSVNFYTESMIIKPSLEFHAATS